ncbi:MAG: DNA polymerase III subunit gamma/tau [Bacilli bacterium]|nr:DNA polymerase III subunit gamma/tau [Bacilli bacterium]
MYQALYRKYRPIDFETVVGQDSIIKTLKNSIINHNFTHAYMFYGPRGTGKTTVSKIFARNINCLNNQDGSACGKCEACKFSFSKECVDIIEIDAASNNGVDEIRELRNKITLVPSKLKYKVYIIDEVHMLSVGAFNALLKTLEEPPEHAIFILATTDPQKVPETVVSRCQCFSFKRISKEKINNQLEYVAKKEKISIDKEVLNNIATLSDGGLRDALGMLDKLTSYTNNKITMKDFIEVNDIISDSEIEEFLDCIFDKNIPQVLKMIDNFDQNGKNLNQIITQILHLARNYIVDYYLDNNQIKWGVDDLQEFTNLLNERIIDIRRSSNSKIFIEMFILKFINDYLSTNIDKKTTNVVKKEEQVDIQKNNSEKELKNKTKQQKKQDKKSNLKVTNIDEIMKVRINNVLAKADKKEKENEEEKFKNLNNYTFDQQFGYLVCNLLDSKIKVVSEDLVLLAFEYDSVVEQNLLILDKLTEIYNKIVNSKKKLVLISENDWQKEKDEYIINLKNKHSYEILPEPDPNYEELDNDDIIDNDAVDLFGDIVEFE